MLFFAGGAFETFKGAAEEDSLVYIYVLGEMFFG